MESIEFINKYESFLDEISEVVRPELLSIINELKEIDPHDLVRPDTFFMSESQGKGFVWNMFIKWVRKISKVE
jgi:hypothetical protein